MTNGHALELAEQAAEALRELNHRTRDARAFTGPAELYRLVGEFALLAGRLPQLLDQLDRWLRAEHDVGRIRSDTCTDPDPDPDRIIAAAGAELADAGDAAHDLAHVLDAAQQHLAQLGATQPDRAPNPGGSFQPAAGVHFRALLTRVAPLKTAELPRRWRSLTTDQLFEGARFMLTREEDVDAHALRRRGWSISAIARHLGKDRRTIRAYLSGERTAGVRAPAGPDVFEPFVVYCRERLAEDPHLWATALHDELRQLGYDRSYPRLTHNLRARQLRPVCHACRPTGGRPAAVIEHPPAEETQWDWLELPDPPKSWDGYGSRGVPARRRPVPLEQVAWGAGRGDGPAAADRRAAPGGDPVGWADPGVAVRPDGHRRAPGHRQGHRLLRGGRETLWGAGQTMPAPAGQPQGCGREGQSHRGATLVAHPARRHHRRRRRRPDSTSSAPPSATPGTASMSTGPGAPSPI